jgi:hypothetical protein
MWLKIILHNILFEKSSFTYGCVFQDNKYHLLEVIKNDQLVFKNDYYAHKNIVIWIDIYSHIHTWKFWNV